MDLMDELQRLEHQLGLATRMLAMIRDRPAATRLAALGDDIRARIDGLKAASLEDAIRRRAYHLWEESGRPGGHDMDFWLEAERQVKSVPPA
jgi:Protein of unknown function (DUF2934)